jgi:hypothetical protein
VIDFRFIYLLLLVACGGQASMKAGGRGYAHEVFVKEIISEDCSLPDTLVGGNNHVQFPIEVSTAHYRYHH